MKAFKAFIKSFKAPQRRVKIKNYVNFFCSPVIEKARVKLLLNINQSSHIIWQKTLVFNIFHDTFESYQKCYLTLSCILLKNGQTYFKDLVVFTLNVWPFFDIHERVKSYWGLYIYFRTIAEGFYLMYYFDPFTTNLFLI